MRNAFTLRNEFCALFRLRLVSICIVTFICCLWRALLLAASNARQADGLSLLALPPSIPRARSQTLYPSTQTGLHPLRITRELFEVLWPYEALFMKLKLKLICDRQSVGQFVWVSGLPMGPLTRFYLVFLFSADNYLIILPKASSLTRRRVCSLQWNHSLVPITILYCLIWDCVPFLSPLTTRRDYGGSILTRLHTGNCVWIIETHRDKLWK
jgi:hypothetical protein